MASNILIFDTETTGLTLPGAARLEDQPEIIEFAWAAFSAQGINFSPPTFGSFLIKPRGEISAEITKITGLTSADLTDAKPFAAHADYIRDLLSAADVLVAHNFSFDAQMLDIEFGRLDLPGVDIAKGLCTVEATLHLFRHRLTWASYMSTCSAVNRRRRTARATTCERCCYA